jgi:Leucine-rich repeat (LRR) protein
MDPTRQIQKQKEAYWQVKTIQNLSNPNRGSDPTVRRDIKNTLDPNLGDIIPKFFGSGCCYPIYSSFQSIPTGSFITSSGIPLSYVPATDIITWTDGNGSHSGDLSEFYITAALSTVTDIEINNQSITSLIIGNELPALTTLNCYSNALTLLDISYSTGLISIDCDSNNLTSLDVSICPNLTSLDCDTNPINSLNITNNTNLTLLFCNNNGLSSLNVSNNSLLTVLACNNNNISSLDVTNLSGLNALICNSNLLTSLIGIDNKSSLTLLKTNNNQLTTVNISNDPSLGTPYVDFSNNLLSQTTVNSMLSELVANGFDGGFAYFNGTGNASPTGGLSNSNRVTLLNSPRNWNTVAVN